MSSRPTLEVAIGFGAATTTNPLSVSWTDVTSYVRLDAAPLAIRRGRATELDRIEAGTLTLALDNRDRRFEPDWNGSPYYPYVRPRARIRVRATVGGITSYLYTGYVTAWEPSYPRGRDAVCRVSAADALAIFARREVTAAMSGAVPTDGAVLTGNAVLHILTQAGWGSYGLVIGAGITGIPTTTTLTGNLRQQLDTVVTTEDGTLFVNNYGYIVFRNRHYPLSDTTLYLTLGDEANIIDGWTLGTSLLGTTTIPRPSGWVSGTVNEQPYLTIGTSYDDTRIINKASATRDGGSIQTAQDTASQVIYDMFETSETGLLLGTDAEALARAQWKVARYAYPALRIERVGLMGGLSPNDGLWTHIVGRDLDDRVDVHKRPPGSGMISQQSRIAAIEHSITDTAWMTTWQLAPTAGEDFIVLNDTARGLLDTDRLAY